MVAWPDEEGEGGESFPWRDRDHDDGGAAAKEEGERTAAAATAVCTSGRIGAPSHPIQREMRSDDDNGGNDNNDRADDASTSSSSMRTAASSSSSVASSSSFRSASAVLAEDDCRRDETVGSTADSETETETECLTSYHTSESSLGFGGVRDPFSGLGLAGPVAPIEMPPPLLPPLAGSASMDTTEGGAWSPVKAAREKLQAHRDSFPAQDEASHVGGGGRSGGAELEEEAEEQKKTAMRRSGGGDDDGKYGDGMSDGDYDDPRKLRWKRSASAASASANNNNIGSSEIVVAPPFGSVSDLWPRTQDHHRASAASAASARNGGSDIVVAPAFDSVSDLWLRPVQAHDATSSAPTVGAASADDEGEDPPWGRLLWSWRRAASDPESGRRRAAKPSTAKASTAAASAGMSTIIGAPPMSLLDSAVTTDGGGFAWGAASKRKRGSLRKSVSARVGGMSLLGRSSKLGWKHRGRGSESDLQALVSDRDEQEERKSGTSAHARFVTSGRHGDTKPIRSGGKGDIGADSGNGGIGGGRGPGLRRSAGSRGSAPNLTSLAKASHLSDPSFPISEVSFPSAASAATERRRGRRRSLSDIGDIAAAAEASRIEFDRDEEYFGFQPERSGSSDDLVGNKGRGNGAGGDIGPPSPPIVMRHRRKSAQRREGQMPKAEVQRTGDERNEWDDDDEEDVLIEPLGSPPTSPPPVANITVSHVKRLQSMPQLPSLSTDEDDTDHDKSAASSVTKADLASPIVVISKRLRETRATVAREGILTPLRGRASEMLERRKARRQKYLAARTRRMEERQRQREERLRKRGINPIVLRADHPLKIVWDVLTVLLTFASALRTHQSIRDRTYDQSPFVVFTECWFLLDVLLNFVTEHKTSSGQIIRDGKAVWARYLTTWFVVDALSLVPWERIYVKPVVEMQKRRNIFKKTFFRSKAVVRVSRVIRGRHIKLFGKVAGQTKHAGVGGKRLLRLIIKYVPKYLLFYRKMRAVLVVRMLRQVHFVRKIMKNFWVTVKEKRAIVGRRFGRRAREARRRRNRVLRRLQEAAVLTSSAASSKRNLLNDTDNQHGGRRSSLREPSMESLAAVSTASGSTPQQRGAGAGRASGRDDACGSGIAGSNFKERKTRPPSECLGVSANAAVGDYSASVQSKAPADEQDLDFDLSKHIGELDVTSVVGDESTVMSESVIGDGDSVLGDDSTVQTVDTMDSLVPQRDGDEDGDGVDEDGLVGFYDEVEDDIILSPGAGQRKRHRPSRNHHLSKSGLGPSPRSPYGRKRSGSGGGGGSFIPSLRQRSTRSNRSRSSSSELLSRSSSLPEEDGSGGDPDFFGPIML